MAFVEVSGPGCSSLDKNKIQSHDFLALRAQFSIITTYFGIEYVVSTHTKIHVVHTEKCVHFVKGPCSVFCPF